MSIRRAVSHSAATAVVLVLLAGLSSDVLGQEITPDNMDVYDPCPTYDACTMFGIGAYWTSTTTRSVGLVPMNCKQSSCRTCQTNPPYRCVSVALWAKCRCDDVPVTGAAAGITMCANQYGDCVIN